MQYKNPADYFHSFPQPRQNELLTLDKTIRAAAPELPPIMAGTMAGYGPYHYKYASGREGDAAIICLRGSEASLSVYILPVIDGKYIPELYKDKLPKAKVGKSCIRFTKLSDIDLAVITEIVKIAAAHKDKVASE